MIYHSGTKPRARGFTQHHLFSTGGAGFIALTSVIIISAILLVVAVSGSLSGIFERFNALDAELKNRSLAAANACVEEARLLLAGDQSYAGTARYTLNSLDSCRVTVSGSSPKLLMVEATSSDAVTNLLVTVDINTLGITSWQEVGHF